MEKLTNIDLMCNELLSKSPQQRKRKCENIMECGSLESTSNNISLSDSKHRNKQYLIDIEKIKVGVRIQSAFSPTEKLIQYERSKYLKEPSLVPLYKGAL